jgi:hypothetical protein
MEGGRALKKTALIFILTILTTLSFGIDFGGNLEDSTILYNSDSSSFYHADTLSLWLKTDLWEDTNLFVSGSYTYTTDNPWFLNLDYLRVVNKSSSLINYSFGRFFTSDFSGYIFSHKLDGGSITFNLPTYIITAKAGYTGLLFDQTSNIEMTLADQTGITYGDFSQSFAAPRFAGGLQAFFPEFFPDQDLRAEVWAQMDLRNESDLTSGGKLDTQYFGISLSGSLIPSLYYNSFAYLGSGQSHSGIGSDYTVFSFLGSAGLRYYMEDFYYSRIAFKFLYSSGDSDYLASFTEGNTEEDSTNFIPISNKSLGLVFSPGLGNIVFTSLSYSLKPFSGMENRTLRNVQFELTDINFFRSTTGQISESGIDPLSTSLYLGTEIDGTVNFRPYSDLGVSLSGGVFIPNNGADGSFLDTKTLEFLGRLGLSFSF